MKYYHRVLFVSIFLIFYHTSFAWGFYAHQKINYYAVFLLPPEMMVLFKPNILFLSEHATDPDKRRYALKEEGPRHYIDIDHYGVYPFPNLPRQWCDAMEKYTEDTLQQFGIVPWHIQVMLNRLTQAFRKSDFAAILKNSAEIGHYIADAHVPLHASSNHNGQLTQQNGIHGFWESRIPELIAEKNFNYIIGKAAYLSEPTDFIWHRVLESANAADSVLILERNLNTHFSQQEKYAFENRNGLLVKQYSSRYTIAYNFILNGMVERRMRQAIYAVASFWYTAWINAGQPNLSVITNQEFSEENIKELEGLNKSWKTGSQMIGRQE
jgi:hypothetical protein